MVIIYNPPTGAIISEKFKADGVSLANPFKPSTTQYCEQGFADALIATYPFLQVVTPDEVKEIKKEVKEEPKKVEVEVVIDSSIPVAETKKSEPKQENKGTEIPDDLKGADWYGDGPKETNG